MGKSIMDLRLQLTEKEARKCGCTYCLYRHSVCEYFGDLVEGECSHFVMGKCFKCEHQIRNGYQFMQGVCDRVFDFSGCENFKEYRNEQS